MDKEFLIKHRKNIAAAAFLGLSSLTAISVCSQPSLTIAQEEISPEMQLAQIKTPLWSDVNFQNIYKKLHERDYLQNSTFLGDFNNRPPFYTDQQPLQWVDFRENSPLLPLLAQEFRELSFLNIYLPSSSMDGICDGVKTFSWETGQVRLSAEAGFLRTLYGKNGQFDGFEIFEVHYGKDGKPSFASNSQFRQFNARFFKVGEALEIGKKSRDYYFMWGD